jgi:hypothetical protein
VAPLSAVDHLGPSARRAGPISQASKAVDFSSRAAVLVEGVGDFRSLRTEAQRPSRDSASPAI